MQLGEVDVLLEYLCFMIDFKSNSLEEWRRFQVDGEVREIVEECKDCKKGRKVYGLTRRCLLRN